MRAAHVRTLHIWLLERQMKSECNVLSPTQREWGGTRVETLTLITLSIKHLHHRAIPIDQLLLWFENCLESVSVRKEDNGKRDSSRARVIRSNFSMRMGQVKNSKFSSKYYYLWNSISWHREATVQRHIRIPKTEKWWWEATPSRKNRSIDFSWHVKSIRFSFSCVYFHFSACQTIIVDVSVVVVAVVVVQLENMKKG